MLVSQDSKTAAMLVFTYFLILTLPLVAINLHTPGHVTENSLLLKSSSSVQFSALSMETRLIAPVLPAVQFLFVWKPLNCRLMYNNSYWKSCENYCFKSYHIFEIQNNVSEDRWQFPRCLPYNDKNSNEVSLGLQERCCFSSHWLFSIERLTRSHVDKKIIACETFCPETILFFNFLLGAQRYFCKKIHLKSKKNWNSYLHDRIITKRTTDAVDASVDARNDQSSIR